MKISAIITCGGSGTRTNLGYNKLKFDIGGMPLITKTINAFSRPDINQIIIPCNDNDYDWFAKILMNRTENFILCKGGNTRQDSVYNALLNLDKDTDLVVIHDGARPFVSQELISNAINDAITYKTAIVCTPAIDSMRIIEDNISKPISRSICVRVQTPQVFYYDSILKAYNKATLNKETFTDDASLYQKYIGDVHLTNGSPENIKITTEDDLKIFKPKNFSVGVGWDTHELVEGRKLILGGVIIPHTKGLLGHSDADVLIHAIMDAILSASHNKDIGNIFPDSDVKYKDISSVILLEKVYELITSQGYYINNISAVVMAQKPKLSPFIQQMQNNIANTLKIDNSQITISSTTTEKLGLVGHEEAISSNAYCSLYRRD